MLRLQKGKVPQHQFVTESCSTELTLAWKHREKEEGGVCAPASVCGRVSVLSAVTSQQQRGKRRIYFSGLDEENENETGGFVTSPRADNCPPTPQGKRLLIND